jgi:hypothetical protein
LLLGAPVKKQVRYEPVSKRTPAMGWTELHSAAGDDDVQVGVSGARCDPRAG